MPECVFVALGSNLGDRNEFLALGRDGLSCLPQTTLLAVSSIEETVPIGPAGQGQYLNQMVLLRTELSPQALLQHCQSIERQAGRVRSERWGSRTLDLDIVRFGDDVVITDDLVIPHPELPNRAFWQREIAELEQHVSTSPSIEFPHWAQIDEARHGHVERVALLVSAWADEMSVADAERERWHKAVVLHDALKDAPAEVLDEIAPGWWDVPGLRHGPAAAVMAERAGETDAGILDAVRYHSVGYSDWETVGRVLFLADYLESGRDFHTELHERLSGSVPTDLNGVLRMIAAERLSASVTYGFPLLPETTAFWNSLVRER